MKFPTLKFTRMSECHKNKKWYKNIKPIYKIIEAAIRLKNLFPFKPAMVHQQRYYL